MKQLAEGHTNAITLRVPGWQTLSATAGSVSSFPLAAFTVFKGKDGLGNNLPFFFLEKCF